MARKQSAGAHRPVRDTDFLSFAATALQADKTVELARKGDRAGAMDSGRRARHAAGVLGERHGPEHPDVRKVAKHVRAAHRVAMRSTSGGGARARGSRNAASKKAASSSYAGG